jgi:hypothetical protein
MVAYAERQGWQSCPPETAPAHAMFHTTPG